MESRRDVARVKANPTEREAMCSAARPVGVVVFRPKDCETSHLHLLRRVDARTGQCPFPEPQSVRLLLQHGGWHGRFRTERVARGHAAGRGATAARARFGLLGLRQFFHNFSVKCGGARAFLPTATSKPPSAFAFAHAVANSSLLRTRMPTLRHNRFRALPLGLLLDCLCRGGLVESTG